ncbi:hypothetical protein D3C77_803700 [compost metagenome]
MDTAGNQQGHGGQVPKGADARRLSMDTVDVDVDRHGLFPCESKQDKRVEVCLFALEGAITENWYEPLPGC